jgi:hypothetical protein
VLEKQQVRIDLRAKIHHPPIEQQEELRKRSQIMWQPTGASHRAIEPPKKSLSLGITLSFI